MTVRLEVGGAVATLRLTAKKGSMAPAFWGDFRAALSGLEGVRALVIRGEEGFSAGLDVNATLPEIERSGDFWGAVRPMQEAFTALEQLPIPTLAAVHGYCIGAGLELAAACDLRLCSADARFSLPEVRLGLVADLGGLQRLPGLIGRGRAAHLALTGAPIDAQLAAAWGLVTEVHGTPEALFERAGALAAELAGLPAAALAGTKRVLQDALPLEEGMRQAGEFNAGLLRR